MGKKTKVVLAGAGKIGEAIVALLQQAGDYELTIVEQDRERLEGFARAGLKTHECAIGEESELVPVLAGHDAVISACPGWGSRVTLMVGLALLKASITLVKPLTWGSKAMHQTVISVFFWANAPVAAPESSRNASSSTQRKRFLIPQRIAPLTGHEEPTEDLKKLRRKTHQTIRKVTTDIEDRFHFNTAISAIMELVNLVYQVPRPEKGNTAALAVIKGAVDTVVILLAPIVPHITEELWEMLGNKGSLASVPWPSYDPELTSEDELTIVIQVNGKLRSRITVSADESEEKIKEKALADEKTLKFLEGVKVVKVITVPKKLVNIVVK